MRLSITLLVLLFAVPAVTAFGISPATYSMLGTGTSNYTLRILNPQHESMQLQIIGVGQAAQFLHPSKKYVNLASSITEIDVPVSLVVPASQLPGEYSGALIVEQLPSSVQGKGFVSAVAAVQQRVNVRVPADGKFVDAHILTSVGSTQGTQVVTVAVQNIGTENISHLTSHTDIRDPSNQLVASMSTKQVSLAVGADKSLSGQWHPRLPGTYTVTATVTYDNRSYTTNRTIQVGTLDVRVGTPVFGNFSLGSPVRIDTPLTSEWNQRLSSVTGTIVMDGPGGYHTSFPTLSTDLPPDGDGTLIGYWNGAGAPAGQYNMTLQVHFADQTRNETYRVGVGVDWIRIEQGGQASFATILLALAALLVLVAAYFAQRYIRRRP